MVLAFITFGLGFLGILFDERRRGWQDRMAGADVLYELNERTPGALVDAGPGRGRGGGPDTTKAPDSRGLRPQHLSGPPLGG